MKHRVKQPGALKETAGLLNSRHKQEILWLHELANPWTSAKTRVPITVVSGLIPCDLYTVDFFTQMIANSSGFAFASYEADQWRGHAFLAQNGATGYPLCRTINSFVGDASPAVGSVATGVSMIQLPDVSSDITNGATGTEYMFVAGGIMAELDYTPQSTGYRGSLWCMRTTDPERYPLLSQTADQILAASKNLNSAYTCVEYKITRSGLLVRSELAIVDDDNGMVRDEGAVGGIGMACYPQTVSSFEWQRVNGAATATVQSPAIAFFLTGTDSGVRVRISGISNYQLERYPTTRVIRSMGQQAQPSTATELLQSVGQLNTVRPYTTLAGMLTGLSPDLLGIAAGYGPEPLYGATSSWLSTQADKNPGLVQSLINGGSSIINWIFGSSNPTPAQINNIPDLPLLGPAKPIGPTSTGPLIEELDEFGNVIGELAGGAEELLPLLAFL